MLIRWEAIFPVDIAIQRLNNAGQFRVNKVSGQIFKLVEKSCGDV